MHLLDCGMLIPKSRTDDLETYTNCFIRSYAGSHTTWKSMATVILDITNFLVGLSFLPSLITRANLR